VNQIFKEPFASNLDRVRRLKKKRDKNDIQTYECLFAKVYETGIYCIKGHKLGRRKDGGITLVQVLKGYSPKICQVCKDFEKIGEEK